MGGGGGGGRSSNSACPSVSVTSELSLPGTFMVGVEEDGFSPEPEGTSRGLGLEILDKPGWNDLSVVEIRLLVEGGAMREEGIGNPDGL